MSVSDISLRLWRATVLILLQVHSTLIVSCSVICMPVYLSRIPHLPNTLNTCAHLLSIFFSIDRATFACAWHFDRYWFWRVSGQSHEAER